MRTIMAAVLGLGLAAGCGKQAAPTQRVESKGEHEHGEGPHGGATGDFGKDRHLEFTVDHGKQEVTVYLLGGDVKTAAPIKADTLTLEIVDPAFTVELKATRQDADPPGTASRFVAKHEKFGKEQEFAGKISGIVDGQSVSGEFKEEPEKK